MPCLRLLESVAAHIRRLASAYVRAHGHVALTFRKCPWKLGILLRTRHGAMSEEARWTETTRSMCSSVIIAHDKYFKILSTKDLDQTEYKTPYYLAEYSKLLNIHTSTHNLAAEVCSFLYKDVIAVVKRVLKAMSKKRHRSSLTSFPHHHSLIHCLAQKRSIFARSL